MVYSSSLRTIPGTAACYRGGQLWDNATEAGREIKAVLTKWVSFYKAHRATLIQPVVHLRRPDMQGWDGWLHVNPFGFGASGDTGSSVVEVGAAVVFNPKEQTCWCSLCTTAGWT